MSTLTLRGPTCRCLYNAVIVLQQFHKLQKKKPRKCYASPREAFESIHERIGWVVKEVGCGILTASPFLVQVICTDSWATPLDASSLAKQRCHYTGEEHHMYCWIFALLMNQDGKGDQLFQEEARGCDPANMFPLGRWGLHTLCTLGKRPQ